MVRAGYELVESSVKLRCCLPQNAEPFFADHVEHIVARQPATHCNAHNGPNLSANHLAPLVTPYRRSNANARALAFESAPLRSLRPRNLPDKKKRKTQFVESRLQLAVSLHGVQRLFRFDIGFGLTYSLARKQPRFGYRAIREASALKPTAGSVRGGGAVPAAVAALSQVRRQQLFLPSRGLWPVAPNLS